MNQFRLIEPQQATPEARDLLENVQSKLGRLPNLFKGMANAPAVLKAYLSIEQSLSESTLSARIREQIALTVAENNGCQYCLAAHTAVGKMLGLSENEIIKNRMGLSEDFETEAVLKFARLLVEHNGVVPDAGLDDIRSAGFSDSKIAEIVATVVMNIFTNYFNLTAKTPIDFPKVKDLENKPVNS